MARGKTPRFRDMDRVDASEPVDIPVTRKSILEADPENQDRCILALSARAARGIKWARIGKRIAYLVFTDDLNTAYRYEVPQGLVKQFDNKAEAVRESSEWIKGHVITLRPCAPTLVLGYKDGKSGTNKRKPRKTGKRGPMQGRHMSFTADWTGDADEGT